MELSNEQQTMIDTALQGYNILVDACIGSGKTTTIQNLCLKLPLNKRILYLTYNKLLKEDAQTKIKPFMYYLRHSNNYEILNYNGYAYKYIKKKVGISEQINEFNLEKPKIPAPDVLIVDEYQDIREDHAEMLRYIKSTNPNMQIIMVGDMMQKIYSNTRLDVLEFIKEFMGEYKELTFTKCFRINKELAKELGEVWNKEIVGVNDDCLVRYISFDDFINFAETRNTSEILCLGGKTGLMARALNKLERDCPDKFNKKTVYASIQEKDANIVVDRNTAIFTTFDSSKGMERDFCFVFDWTEEYWRMRTKQTNAEYEIIRNLFCVAASRGKRGVVFVIDPKQHVLHKETMKKRTETNYEFNHDLNISDMFDFKFAENIRDCYDSLGVKKIDREDMSEIKVRVQDEKIDLSPCIGVYQEACFFKGFDMQEEYKLFNKTHSDFYLDYKSVKDKSMDEQICTLVAGETRQNRYKTQVEYPIIKATEKTEIMNRLKTIFKETEDVQVGTKVNLGIVKARGYADVVKDSIVYELKFVSELQETHFLQCAMYMIGLKLEKGILWNVRTNEMWEIRVKDKEEFLKKVVIAITNGHKKNFKTEN